MAVLVSYPEIFWKVWKFTKSPNGWWRQLAELVEAGDVLATALTRIFIEDMCEEAGIREKPFDNYGKLSLTHHQMESMLQQLAPRYDYSFAHFKGGLLRTHKVLTDGGDFSTSVLVYNFSIYLLFCVNSSRQKQGRQRLLCQTTGAHGWQVRKHVPYKLE